jgi:signal peptidase II
MMPTGRVERPGGLRARVGRPALLLAVAGVVIAADQGTKSWAQESLASVDRRHVVGPVYFLLTFNRGAAFSLGSGASPVIEALAVVLVIAVLWFSGRLAKGAAHPVSLVAFGLVSGGAVSNLADRFFRHHHGAVVDFIQLVSWWPVFNVADAAITVGAITVAVMFAFFSVPKRALPPRAAAGPAAWPATDAAEEVP